jgi:hypothetical protein
MKKGKMLVGILIGIAATLFVSKNKWCQEQLAKAKEKGEEILNRCKQNNEEESPASEEK